MISVAENPHAAAEQALNLFGDDILRLSYSYLKRREDAEDIVQETLLRLMQSSQAFRDEEHMKAWLLRVAANLCKDFLRLARSKREVTLGEENGYEPAAPQTQLPEGGSDIMEAVLSLPEKYRSVIHLYYFEEYATKEIAEILGLKDVTVRKKKMEGDGGHAGGI